MANVRIQPGRALNAAISNNANIPLPLVNTTGTDNGAPVNQLIDTTKNFIALNVYVGDIVYNLSTLPITAATIVSSPLSGSPDTLELNANIFTGAGDSYVIYQSSPQAGGQNTGCVLYVGTGGDLIVSTVDNDIVTFYNVQSGTFMPVQVLKVWESYTFPSGAVTTSAADITALW
jgi:hypothetical protein